MWSVLMCDVMGCGLMRCDVMWVVLHLLKCSLDTWDDTRYSSALWVLQNRHYGTVDLLCRRIVMLQSAVKVFITLYQILRLMNVFIRLYFDQINFSPQNSHTRYFFKLHFNIIFPLNPLNAELNPICHLLALLGAHPALHVSRTRVKYI
jgi:hypothetical protein